MKKKEYERHFSKLEVSVLQNYIADRVKQKYRKCITNRGFVSLQQYSTLRGGNNLVYGNEIRLGPLGHTIRSFTNWVLTQHKL